MENRFEGSSWTEIRVEKRTYIYMIILCMYTHTRTHTRTHTHTYIHVHIHTRTHTYTWSVNDTLLWFEAEFVIKTYFRH